MNISEGKKGVTYTVKSVNGDHEMNTFLFSLGCFSGEKITIIKKMRSNFIVNIKGGRYGIDKDLASVIEVI
ncbi:FeoA family protein [Haloplasma contractile]|nr:FeoA family protein [Haloplasma contractile]